LYNRSDAHHDNGEEIRLGVLCDGVCETAMFRQEAYGDEDTEDQEFGDANQINDFPECGETVEAQGEVGEEEGETEGGEGGEEPGPRLPHERTWS
jgi:hypothetical protein